jgi:hypothetical protein
VSMHPGAINLGFTDVARLVEQRQAGVPSAGRN